MVSSCRQNVRRSALRSARKLPSGESNAHSAPKGGGKESAARDRGWLILPSIRTKGLIVDIGSLARCCSGVQSPGTTLSAAVQAIRFMMHKTVRLRTDGMTPEWDCAETAGTGYGPYQ